MDLPSIVVINLVKATVCVFLLFAGRPMAIGQEDCISGKVPERSGKGIGKVSGRPRKGSGKLCRKVLLIFRYLPVVGAPEKVQISPG